MMGLFEIIKNNAYLYNVKLISDKSAPIFQMSEKLTWSHICELVTIDDQLEREFYERECISEGWTVNVHVTGTDTVSLLLLIRHIATFSTSASSA